MSSRGSARGRRAVRGLTAPGTRRQRDSGATTRHCFRPVRRRWHSPRRAVGWSAGQAAGLVCGPVAGRAGQRAVRAAADLGGVRAAVGRWAGRRGEGAGGRRPGRVVCCRAGPVGGAGVPCARPLTPAVGVGALAVHAEESRPGGELLRGNSPDVAVRYAVVFARLMAELADVTVAPPLPNPRWVRWDHTDSVVWPAIGELDDRDQGAVPTYVVDTADQAPQADAGRRSRLTANRNGRGRRFEPVTRSACSIASRSARTNRRRCVMSSPRKVVLVRVRRVRGG